MNRAAVAMACALLWACPAQAASWVELGGARYDVEVAETEAEQARGLMFRQSLPHDRGMLFVYPEEGWRSFWMKNTAIPLDILYFDDDQRLINWHQASPCRSNPCPGYPSRQPARYVLELNAGTATSLGLKPGDRMEIHHEP